MSAVKTRVPRNRTKRARCGFGAAALGIQVDDARAAVRLVRAGLPFSRLKRFEKVSGLTREKIAHFAAIRKRTLLRRQHTGRLQPDESDRLLRAARIFELAVELFEGDKAAARQWLQSPQLGLGGEVPLEFASTEVGAREVENLIIRLEHGIII